MNRSLNGLLENLFQSPQIRALNQYNALAHFGTRPCINLSLCFDFFLRPFLAFLVETQRVFVHAFLCVVSSLIFLFFLFRSALIGPNPRSSTELIYAISLIYIARS